MTQELHALSDLIKFYLEELSPVLSGNMVREILMAELVNVSDHEVTFCISAPFYDMKLWREKGVIVHSNLHINIYGGKSTHASAYGDITDYAMWVNELGAFGSQNESMHWVNRVCDMCAHLIPNAEVINRLELS